MYSSLSLLALGLASTAAAQKAGSIVEVGDSQVSGMMVRTLLNPQFTPRPSPCPVTDVRRQQREGLHS